MFIENILRNQYVGCTLIYLVIVLNDEKKNVFEYFFFIMFMTYLHNIIVDPKVKDSMKAGNPFGNVSLNGKCLHAVTLFVLKENIPPVLFPLNRELFFGIALETLYKKESDAYVNKINDHRYKWCFDLCGTFFSL